MKRGRGVARQECTCELQSVFQFCEGSARSLQNPLISPSLPSFLQSSCTASSKQNFSTTYNHFHALEMATFSPISYNYVPTALRSKSAATRCKPASKQLNILDKLQHSKLSYTALDGPQLPAAAAANNGGYRSGIQGMF
jgi:hypothetical protein